MTLSTRKPTGKPPWPIVLIAGCEKAGKTYSAAEASASDLIGRTLWFGIGEDDPDEYGTLGPFEIVETDGTYRGLVDALSLALREPQSDNKPTLWVLDSGSRLWALLSDMAQVEANRRWKNKDANKSKDIPDDGISINMDLWNIAKQRWQHILDLLREHQGPSIITARLDQTTVVDAGGNPTKDKVWKVQAEKGLTFDVGVVVEMRARDEVLLTGVRSLRFVAKKSHTPYPKFTVDDLWRKLGLAEEAGTRVHSAASGEESVDANDRHTVARGELLKEIAAAADAAGIPRADVAKVWAEEHGGQSLANATDLGAMELLRDDLQAKAREEVPVA
jgi:hypothetical protein